MKSWKIPASIFAVFRSTNKTTDNLNSYFITDTHQMGLFSKICLTTVVVVTLACFGIAFTVVGSLYEQNKCMMRAYEHRFDVDLAKKMCIPPTSATSEQLQFSVPYFLIPTQPNSTIEPLIEDEILSNK